MKRRGINDQRTERDQDSKGSGACSRQDDSALSGRDALSSGIGILCFCRSKVILQGPQHIGNPVIRETELSIAKEV